MKPLKLFIIGNQFEKFSNSNSIMTYDKFNVLIRNKNIFTDQEKIYQIYLGQGLSEAQINAIDQRIKDGMYNNRVLLTGLIHALRHSPNYILFKNKTKSCLISEPENTSANLYRSFLLLSEENISESSKYISTTLLIDASRQLLFNVSKKFHASSYAPKECVIHQLNTCFFENTLPLDVELILKIDALRQGLYGNFKSTGSIQAIQNKKTVMTMAIDFTVLDKKTLLDIETQQAETAVLEMLNTAGSQAVNRFAA